MVELDPNSVPSTVALLRQLLADGFLMLEIRTRPDHLQVLLGFDDLRVTLTLTEADAEQILQLGLGRPPPGASGLNVP